MSLPTSKTITHADFAHRMQLSSDGNETVPPLHHGRLGWFVEEFEKNFDFHVTVETVRKWFAGEARPRPGTIEMLAQILEVDHAWLSVGTDPSISEKERKVRNASADGVVNVVAGCIQMDGGHPAFPDANDAASKMGHVDLTAIIKGALYAIHVALAQKGEDSWVFSIPVGAREKFVIGVVRISPWNFRFFELDWDGIDKHGTRRSGYLSVVLPFDMKPSLWKEMESFSERI